VFGNVTRAYARRVSFDSGDDSAVEEVAEWFRSRGFRLSSHEADGGWWASLTGINNPDSVVQRYGRGASAGAAARRARERWIVEQVT
jgi:hypothetical protein